MLRVKILLVLLAGLLPASKVKNRLLGRLGHDIHPTATIAPVILLRVRKLRVGENTAIGAWNAFRGLRLVHFGSQCQIGPRNDFRAGAGKGATSQDDSMRAVLRLGDAVFVTKRHTIDCTGGVKIGDWSGLSGRDIFIYSHGYEPRVDDNTVAVTEIGRNCLVGPKSTMAKGAYLPDGSILAMGAILMPGATKTRSVYGGIPAKPLSVDMTGWKFLERKTISPRNPRGSSLQPAFAATDDAPMADGTESV